MNVSTFEELRNAINNMVSSITLMNDLTTTGTSILIDHSVFIDGNGFRITRTPAFTESFFTISNETVSFSNFTLNGNNIENTQPLIMITGGSLTLEEMILENNISNQGGAIQAISTTNTNFFLSIIQNTIIEHCQANQGGGIWANFVNPNGSDSITLSTNTSINDNQAILGGGIYAENSGNGFGRINIVNNASIQNNQAQNGGGIYYTNNISNQFQSSTRLNLTLNTNANIHHNIASENGGGIYFLSTNRNDVFSAINSMCDQNQAQNGGGIYFDLTNGAISPSIQGCTFQENQAQMNGGAIAYILRNPGNNIISNALSIITWATNSFNQNKAQNGGVFFTQDTITDSPIHINLSFNNSIFNSNEATENGGCLCFLGNSTIETSINNSRMINNTATNGGCVYDINQQNNSPLHLNNVTLTNNKSTDNGGCIYMIKSGNSTLTINNSNASIMNNEARNGGVVYYQGNNENGVISRGDFSNNQAAENGGVFYIINSNLQLSDSTLEDNKANQNGGAIYIDGGNNHRLEDNQFINNQARNGGAIFNTNQGIITSTFDTFTSNQAQNNGGGIANENGNINIDGDSFSQNKAIQGGAIYNYGNSTITINNITTIFRNSSSSGGGIYNTNGATLLLNSVEFFENTASTSGAGIYNNTESTVKMKESVSMSENESPIGKDVYNGGELEIQGLVQMNTGLYLPSKNNVPLLTGPLTEGSHIQLENSTYVTPSTGSPIVIGIADQNLYPLLQESDANSYQKPFINFDNWIIRLSDDKKEVWLFLNVITYNIQYCNLAGTVTTNPTTYTENDLPILLTPPTTRRCYVFLGWFLDNQKISSIPIGTTGNLTICARWERVSKSYFCCKND